jgi:transposase
MNNLPPLDQLPPHLRASVQAVLQANQRLELENKLLREQMRLLRLEKYGPKSEKLNDGQLALLDEEPVVTKAEVQAEAAREPLAEPAAPPRRRPQPNHPGRVALPDCLERREIVIPCAEPEKLCPQCGAERPIIGYEVTEELDVQPAIYFVRVTKREKRGSHCLPEHGVVTAACPSKIIPKSKLSDLLIIDSVIKKFLEHMPLYRQCAMLERDAHIELSRQTLTESILAVGQLLEPLRQVLRRDLLAKGYIQADETPVPCQSERTRGRNHQAYLWEYSRPGGPVVFDFRMGRGREGPAKFLEGFVGKLQTDAYAAYDKLGPDLVYVGCWAHARRHFHKAHVLAPLDPLPKEVLEQIAELYRIETQAREQGLSVQARLELRQRCSRPVLERLKERIVAIRQALVPGTKLGQACDYALGNWPRLAQFTTDGRLEADNNWCENSMRPIALGRRNWLHIGSELAGPKIAAIASIIETCRRLDINVRAYLNDILPKLPEWPINRVEELSPLIWQEAVR